VSILTIINICVNLDKIVKNSHMKKHLTHQVRYAIYSPSIGYLRIKPDGSGGSEFQPIHRHAHQFVHKETVKFKPEEKSTKIAFWRKEQPDIVMVEVRTQLHEVPFDE
jgi:hypothetical protein